MANNLRSSASLASISSMDSDFSSTSVMKTRPSDSVTVTKLFELVFVVVSVVETSDTMVDAGELCARDSARELHAMDGLEAAGELRVMDVLEPMDRLNFEKKEHILRFFEFAIVSALGARETLDAVKPVRLQKLEVLCSFERTFCRDSANWSAH